MTRTNKTKLRNKIVSKGRVELNRSIRSGQYFDELRKHGVMDVKEMISDREFMDSLIEEIEESRKKSIVYDYDYKRDELEKWKKQNRRKLTLRSISEKAKIITEKEKEGEIKK